MLGKWPRTSSRIMFDYSPGSGSTKASDNEESESDYRRPRAYRTSPIEEPLLHGVCADTSQRRSYPRILAQVLATLLVWALGAFCGALAWPRLSGALEQGVGNGQLDKLDVLGRDVFVYRPAVAKEGEQLAAVVVLHGSEDYPLSIAKASGMPRLAEQLPEGRTFLPVFPEMATPGGEVWGYADDVGFFTQLADTLVADYNAKRSEVFVCGHSAGGTMSLFLQNDMPDVFRAAAAVEAGVGQVPQWTAKNSGRPVMVVWNHNDPVLQLFGGDGLLSKTLKTLRRHDTAAVGPSFSERIPVSNATVVSFARRIAWGAGNSTPPTVLVSWRSQVPSHNWASNENFPGGFDASVLLWQFFLASRAWKGSTTPSHGVDRLLAAGAARTDDV